MKKLIFLSLLILTFIVLAIKTKRQVPPSAPEIKQRTFEDAISSISEKDCAEDLAYLSSDELEGRMSGKKGNVAAAEYILRKLEEYGLRTTTQQFKITRTNAGPKGESGDDFTRNVYGWVDGNEFKNEIVVVGAHFDHIGYGPKHSRSRSVAVHNGADDNASGTVAVLAIAKAMAKLKPARTVVFQFYSAEEMGLIGSRFYCDNPIFPIEAPDIRKHVAMVNLDMVGHLNADQFRVSIPEGVSMQPIIDRLSGTYAFARKITGRGTGGSDHASFYNKKIPVAFIHTGTHEYYHTPEDDISTLNIPGIVEISKYAFELSWLLANEGRPEFNEDAFDEMPYTHDHEETRF